MHRFLENIELNRERDLFAPHGLGQGGIGVAAHAFVVGDGCLLWCGRGRVGLGRAQRVRQLPQQDAEDQRQKVSQQDAPRSRQLRTVRQYGTHCISFRRTRLPDGRTADHVD